MVLRLPDGSPAPGVPVHVTVEASAEESWKGITDQDGAVSTVFNINTLPSLTVKVSITKLSEAFVKDALVQY